MQNEDQQWKRAMEYVDAVSELNYMSQVSFTIMHFYVLYNTNCFTLSIETTELEPVANNHNIPENQEIPY